MSITVGEAVRIVRREAGLTQAAFAARLEVTQAHVSKVESGRVAEPSYAFLELVRRRFGLDPLLLVALSRGAVDVDSHRLALLVHGKCE